MPYLLRRLLSPLMVAMMTIALVSTSWHGLAQAGSPGPTVSAPGSHGQTAQAPAEHRHSAPAKAHTTGQGCCHPACTMAIVPPPAGTAQALLVSAPVRVSRDLIPAPTPPPGLDRPPKIA